MIRKYGYIPSKVDTRDEAYRFTAAPQLVLPPLVDLRKQCSTIKDQGQRGTCTCEGLGGLLEFGHKPAITASVLFPYYNSGVTEGDTSDVGREPRDVLASALHDGVCLSRYWPYSRAIGVKPSKSAYAHATYHITSYHTLAGLQDVKAWLVTGSPVYIGFTVRSSFEGDWVIPGMMPIPASDEEIVGGHMIDFVGYADSKQAFIARNSWGTHWQNMKGYFYFPFQLMNKDNVQDMWAVII